MPASGRKIAPGRRVGTVHREVGPAVDLEGERSPGDLLQAAGDFVLGDRFLDARPDRPPPQGEDHPGHRHQEDQVEAEQERVIEGQDDQADPRPQDDRDAVEHQQGRDLLHGQDVEEPVDQLRPVVAVVGVDPDPRQAIRQV